MREAVFLRQNQAKWRRYQTEKPAGPEELAARFIELTDDLAYARTFYPSSPVVQELNALTSQVHQSLYRNRPERTSRFGQFWRHELPFIVARHHRTLAWTLLIFLVFTAIGALSAAYDDTFVRVVLGDGYVNRTLENIERGDPMAVYKSQDEAPMFLFIAFNNVRVALMCFALGATAGLGTVVVMFYNGLMLGSFQYFFYAKGLLLTSFLTIWIHGTLEISAIVLAAGAGFVMARGILFPGTYSRAEAFRQSAAEGSKLALGLVPIIVLAAFLEGFVTRHTEMPLAASLAIIGGSLAFIIWYFILYPLRVRRQLTSDSESV